MSLLNKRFWLMDCWDKSTVFVQSLSCVQLCDAMDCSMPSFPVLHYLPEKEKWTLLSCVWLFATPWSIVHGILQTRILEWIAFLQGIFPTQGLNPGLPHCRQILYQLSHKGRPRIQEWVAYPFSSGSSQCRNQTRVSCIVGGFFTNWASLLKFMSTESVMPSNHVILHWCLLLLPSNLSQHQGLFQWVGSLHLTERGSLEKGMANHSSILASRKPMNSKNANGLLLSIHCPTVAAIFQGGSRGSHPFA